MTVYYALGGGLGHETRARRVLQSLGVQGAEIIGNRDVPAALEGDRERHRAWAIERFSGHRVIVDAFPAGLQGELSGIEGVSFDYVARLLRWDEYKRAIPEPPPRFGTTYVVEPLTEAHDSFVRAASAQVIPLSLGAPSPKAPALGIEGDYSLVIHSGPAEEVRDLMAFARELGHERVHVVTRCDMPFPEGFARLSTDRPFDYFAGAKRIVSAAGFNLMLETEPWRDKHHVVPQPRRFDDQYLRAARRRAACLAADPAPSASRYGRVAPAPSSSAQRA
jgi:hypothetical protein